jgi:hypothetical protein
VSAIVSSADWRPTAMASGSSHASRGRSREPSCPVAVTRRARSGPQSTDLAGLRDRRIRKPDRRLPARPRAAASGQAASRCVGSGLPRR